MPRKAKLVRPEADYKPGFTFTFRLDGNIPSKKNRVRFGAHGVYHDKKFSDWHKQAVLQLLPQDIGGRISKTQFIRIFFTFESFRVKDLTNAAESIMDLLVDCGILKDDNFKVVPHLDLEAVYCKGVSKTEIRIEV